jgi:hypothetical protein
LYIHRFVVLRDLLVIFSIKEPSKRNLFYQGGLGAKPEIDSFHYISGRIEFIVS